MIGQALHGDFGSTTRQRILKWLVFLMAGVFILRLGWLQIIQGGAYRLRAEAQAIKQIKIEPFRGMMIDRNGIPIVQNIPGFSVTVTPYQFTSVVAVRLAKILGVPDSVIRADVAKAARFNRFNPVKFAAGRDIDFSTMSAIEEQRDFLPGVDVITDPKRSYDITGNAAHLLGYCREVSEYQLKELGDAYDPGDLTGKTGLEKSYEAYVRGQKGLQFVAVNNRGQRVSSFNEGKSDVPTRRGFDLQLGLDAKLQSLAEKLLEGKRGAVVAIDPNNGEILAFASMPDFSLRELSGRTSRGYYNQIASDPDKPLFNRASMPNYPPGSTWKMLVALGCLQEGLITPNTVLHCGGAYNYGNRSMACHGAHGAVTLERAIQVSCNVYFAQCGMKLDVEGMKKYGTLFGFGHKTMADITEEASGLVPGTAYMDKRYGKNGWSKYAPANWGIGQGEILTTPLQLARYVAAIANGGILLQPHAVRSVYNNVLNKTEVMRYAATDLHLRPDYVRAVQQGMYKVVNEPGGTASSLRIPDIVMCGKTGTAQNPHGRDHSWFVCYAPMDKPQIAICAMVENAGFGSTVAAPIATKLVELYLKGRWPADVRSPGFAAPPSADSALPEQKEKSDTVRKQPAYTKKGPFIVSEK
ncbi:MAG: penicillin-binding protein 2 [Chlorobi bacterium]|nr:MAG: penicillin-binding protein 2 [Bacteroidota bacterium]MBE2265459.1 penicillin-binding protein 2 [Flavobacteriales bacterium]MBL1160523.1 penicillin-binding protein 2 [Chlorobiota bacterium]MBZ0194330.1 penicillin-binding protein 2 [Candidatus Kapabacteria bacterium]MCC6331283.1 penicillin-binding protein 2 [Ignavibacteria bacterium]